MFSLQGDPRAKEESQTSKPGILLSSLTLGQEQQCVVALGEVRPSPGAGGIPACSVTTKKGQGEEVKIRPAWGSVIVSTSGPQLPEQPVLSPTQCSGDGPLSLPGPGGGHECEGRDEVRQWGLFC